MTAIQTRSEHALAQGIRNNVPAHITGSLVLDLMGADRVQRNKIYREVKALARHVVG